MSVGISRWPKRAILAAVVGAGLAGACGSGSPPPPAPSTGSSTTPVTVTGVEKLQWDQAASSASQLAGYRYIGYVDEMPPMELAGATCATTSAANGTFACSAPLPKMSPGLHRLQLATEETGGDRRLGSKSGVLLLNVVPPKPSP
jgi:hypothetical protein